ncbi:hypothetical protein IV102_18600 [bacterium]|nr:hypothetical protein [bacterium]
MLGPGSSFEELMRSGYEEVGLAGSPFRLLVWLRRLTAGAVGFEVIREELLAVLQEDFQGFGNSRGEYGNL